MEVGWKYCGAESWLGGGGSMGSRLSKGTWDVEQACTCRPGSCLGGVVGPDLLCQKSARGYATTRIGALSGGDA